MGGPTTMAHGSVTESIDLQLHNSLLLVKAVWSPCERNVSAPNGSALSRGLSRTNRLEMLKVFGMFRVSPTLAKGLNQR